MKIYSNSKNGVILDGVSLATLKVCSSFWRPRSIHHNWDFMWQQGWKYVKESCAVLCLIK